MKLPRLFGTKPVSLSITSVLTFAFSVQLEDIDLLADQELLLRMSPVHPMYGSFTWDMNIDDENGSDANDSFLISCFTDSDTENTETYTESTENIYEWRRSCDDFQLEIQLQAKCEVERKRQSMSDEHLDRLLSHGMGLKEAVSTVGRLYSLTHVSDDSLSTSISMHAQMWTMRQHAKVR